MRGFFFDPRFISIHAPPRGATVMGSAWVMKSSISIHAPPRGATKGDGEDLRRPLFQFTPLREGRQQQVEAIKTV